MAEIPKVKHCLSRAEKLIVVRVHAHFLRAAARPRVGKQHKVRKLVADACGISTALVSEIVAEYKAIGDPTKFMLEIPFRTHERDRTPEYDPAVVTLVRSLVYERNIAVQPITSKLLASDLFGRHGIVITERTLRRLLTRNGFYFGCGKRLQCCAESVGNLAFRAAYLRTKVSNLTHRNLPRQPEIYLDESYCNLNHVSQLAWIDKDNHDSVQYEKSGKGPRVCIVGSGVIASHRDKIVSAEWIPGSFHCWSSKKTKRSHSTLDNDDDDEDYHGNFNADVFERWFDRMCRCARERYGPCRIYMDGASYHKRRVNTTPSSKNIKQDIIAWLDRNCVVRPQKATKAELLMLVRANKPAPIYATTEIAVACGHTVHWTPPYHPELNPIELIWANIKRRVASNPASTMTDLEAKVNEYRLLVGKEEWVSCWRHSHKFEKKYLEMMEEQDEMDMVEPDGDSANESEDDVDTVYI
ncbi:hypothetical protein AeRB84_017210 [Aphanomyces euteiches]|nr:hypothetical protein AeRB84_017210 [Aphanomyces euteiches]